MHISATLENLRYLNLELCSKACNWVGAEWGLGVTIANDRGSVKHARLTVLANIVKLD